MATLSSPGVQTSIIDESIYDSSAPGSVPLIVIATASNKVSPTGTGIAPYTANENAAKLFVATSQRELVQNFGNPLFYTAGGLALHGHELNEYGLHAAYQFLGLASTAFILRADVDTAQLIPSDSAPTGAPVSGTYWFDTHNTAFGVFKSNGKAVAGEAWVSQPVTPYYLGQTTGNNNAPAAYLGKNGDFGVVVHTNENTLFEKVSGSWVKVGSPEWQSAHPTSIVGTVSNPTVTASHSLVLNGSTVPFSSTSVTSVASAINNHADFVNGPISATVVNGALHISDSRGHDLTIANGTGTPLTALGISAGTTKGNREFFTNGVAYPTGSVAGDVWVKGSATNRGALWSLKVYNAAQGYWQEVAAPFYPFSAGVSGNDDAALAAFGSELAAGRIYVGYDAAKGVMQLRRYSTNGFEALVYEASPTAPTASPEAGTMWYSTDFRADIMVSNGSNWIAYRNFYPDTNPRGPFISGSQPQLQSDGTPLVDYDLWIDATDLDNYPVIRRYEVATQRWKLIDTTDQTSPFGMLFADARQDSGPTFAGHNANATYVFNSEDINDMLFSDFVDPDAPDPRSVPEGMLLFNTRYSTYNVKQWQPEYFGYGVFDTNTDYSLVDYTVGDPVYTFSALAERGRWVSISGNRPDGSPLMGRRAQRAVVVKAMAEAVNASQDARSEIVAFNLIAAPGYPELIDEMVNLNTDQGEVSFIVGDSPVRLKPDANSLSAWANNRFNAASNGEDGLTTSNPYTAVYYPWGMSTNIDGSDIMVPPSTMVLRTMAYNDQVSYPWFAPAGFTRGLVSNATTVGYLDADEEFRAVMLSQGQRDTLYQNRLNPIALIPNRGLVVYGQKTRAPTSTALDRVNVARLVNYLRTSLDLLVKPFLFEQNDVQTRDSVRLTVDRFLNGLVGLRGLEDYAVQCNEDNNTGERIDRNELWVDIAIKPLKAIEFIYIPIRIENSGSVL